MKSTIYAICLLIFSLHLGADEMDNIPEKLRTSIDHDKVKIKELIEKGSCKKAVDISKNGLDTLSKEYKDEPKLKLAKSVYYGMIHEAYANKNGMCEEDKNNKLALSYLIMQVNASDANYYQLGDVYFFGRYGQKVDSIKALKYYMKEYAKNNLKRGNHLYHTAQILIKMNREDKAAVFLRKNFDCIKSQALLKEIEEGKGCGDKESSK